MISNTPKGSDVFLLYCRSEGGEFEVIMPHDPKQLDWWVASIHYNGWFEVAFPGKHPYYLKNEQIPVHTFWVVSGFRQWPQNGEVAALIKSRQDARQ